MKKIVKNCLIGASLVVMLAFTLFLSINAKNNIKAAGYTYSNQIENEEIIEANTNYYINYNEAFNLLNDNTRTVYNYYNNIQTLIAYQLLNNNTMFSCTYNYENDTCTRISDAQSYTFSTTTYRFNVGYTSQHIFTLLYNNVNYIVYIVSENKLYKVVDNYVAIDPNTNEPIVLYDNIENGLFTLNLIDTSQTYKFTVNSNSIGNIYKHAELPPPSSNDFVSSVVDGLGSIFTNFVPSFVSAVVLTAQTAFITESGTGTIVLGALVAACGIALTISILRFVLNLIKLKRKV